MITSAHTGQEDDVDTKSNPTSQFSVFSSQFKKSERIVSQKLIEELFGGSQSHSLAAFPLRAVYMQRERQEGQEPVEVLVSVSKKRFHHAVDRNRVKRQIREAYRLQKQILIERTEPGQTIAIAFIWLTNQHFPTAEVSTKVRQLLERIAKRIEHQDV
jgi:ribonuclease P protein component